MSFAGDPQDTPKVEVVANQASAATAYAGNRNQALELAGAVQDIAPAAQEFVRNYNAELQKNAQADATKKAIALKGQGYAEAVRQGKIDPTASPFWMQAYKNESAKVGTQNAVDQLNVDAASWSEQSDPAAFRQKYTDSITKIGEQYQTPEEQMGYNSVATQALQSALSANTEKNVQAIQSTRIQNLSSLTTQAVLDTISKAGGKASPQAVSAAMEPLKQQWLSTGGRLPDWNQHVALPAIQAAAFQTWNPGVVDLAKGISNGGGGSLYDEAGAAEGLETIRHRIDQDNRQKLSVQMQEDAFRRERDLYAAQGGLFKALGPSIYTGTLSADQAQAASAALAAQGHQPAAIAGALKLSAEVGSSYREIAANRYASYQESTAGASHIASMHQEAVTTGWTPEFDDEVGSLALQGSISVQTQDQLLDTARKRSLALSTIPGASPSGSRVFNNQASNILAWRNSRATITKTIAGTVGSLATRAGVQLSPSDQEALQDVAINAATDHIQTTPVKAGGGKKDYAGAQQAASLAAQGWLQAYLARNNLSTSKGSK